MTGKQESSSTRRLRTDSALAYLIPGAKTAAQAHAVNCGHRKNQTNQSSDNCQRALERNSRPNHPQFAPRSSRRPPPHQPFFPKILQEPWKCVTLVLATAIRARGPAVTRHFATHEHRLPIFPMSPNHAERTAALPVQPCRIRPLAAIPPKPFSERLRSSQIVSDRLGSSGIVPDRTTAPPPAARRPPFPQNCRNIRPIPPAEPAKERVNSRQNTPAKASEKKAFPRHLGVVVFSNDRSTKVGIYSMPAFNSDSGSHESWRADRRASRSRQPCPTPESDELEFRQMSTSPKHHPPSAIHYSPSTIHNPLSPIRYPLSAIRYPLQLHGRLPPQKWAASLSPFRRPTPDAASLLQSPARHPDKRYTGSNQPENTMAALTQRRRIDIYARQSCPPNTHHFDAAQPAPAAATRHLDRRRKTAPRPPERSTWHTLSPLFRPGNFAAVAPMVPAVNAMSPIVDKCRPKGDQCRQKTVKRRPMSAQCRPKPQPATSCHERPPKYPVTRKKKSSPKEGTLEDIGRLRYPIDTLLFHARCPPRPSAGRSQRTGWDPSAAPPPAGTVNLKSPQLQKPHVPSTLK